MPDPTLKQAAEEIKAVLSKHDIAGIVFLGSPTHSEYVYELCPAWSCAKMEGGKIRIKAHRDDFASPEAQKKCVETTTGIFAGFLNLCQRGAENMASILKVLATRFDIQHRDRHE